MTGNVESPLLVAKYCLLFLVPSGSNSSKKPSFTRNFNRFVRMLVAIFSFDSLNCLNLVFLCKIESLNMSNDHLSPRRSTEYAMAQVGFVFIGHKYMKIS